MGKFVIRSIDDSILARLKKRASDQGLSLEESVRRVLAELAGPSKVEVAAHLRRIRAMSRRRTKRPFAEDLVREGGGEKQ